MQVPSSGLAQTRPTLYFSTVCLSIAPTCPERIDSGQNNGLIRFKHSHHYLEFRDHLLRGHQQSYWVNPAFAPFEYVDSVVLFL